MIVLIVIAGVLVAAAGAVGGITLAKSKKENKPFKEVLQSLLPKKAEKKTEEESEESEETAEVEETEEAGETEEESVEEETAEDEENL